MLDRSAGDPTGSAAARRSQEDDDARDRAAAAAPSDAVRALVAELDRVRPAACRAARPVTWQEQLEDLRVRAAALARARPAEWLLAAGAAVPLDRWTAGTWAADLRAALLADGFTPRAADRAVDVVAVDLQHTCPGQTGDGAPGPLEAHPVLARLRPQLSADPPEPASAGWLVARVAALRG